MKKKTKKSAIETMLNWKYDPSEIEERVDHREFTEKEKVVISKIAIYSSKEAARNGYVDDEQMTEILDNVKLIPEEEAIAYLDGLLKEEKIKNEKNHSSN